MITEQHCPWSLQSSCYMYIRKISSIKKYISQIQCETLVHAFISSRLDMCNSLFFGMSAQNISKLQRIQNAALRIIFRKKKRDSVSDDLKSLHWLTVSQRISFKVLTTVFKCIHGLGPIPLSDLIVIKDDTSCLLEVKNFFPSTKLGKRAFCYFGPRQWNCLPVQLRMITNLPCFKSQVKHHLFDHFDDFCRLYHRYDTQQVFSFIFSGLYALLSFLILSFFFIYSSAQLSRL